MNLYYCPACGQLYKAASAKYTSFCIRCGQPTPKKASPAQEQLYQQQQAEIEKLHRWFPTSRVS